MCFLDRSPLHLLPICTVLALCVAGLSASAQPNVIAWGSNASGQTNVPPDLTNAIAVAGGYDHSLALRTDGTVSAWGGNGYGQTNVPVDLTNAVAVACGSYYSLALKADGTVVGWGLNTSGQATPTPGLSNVVAIAAGGASSFGLLADGSLISWGQSVQGLPTPLGNIMNVGVSPSLAACFGVTVNGKLLGFAAPVPNNKSLTNFVTAIYAGSRSVALTIDGRVTTWTSPNGPFTDAGLSSIVAISVNCSGQYLALRTDGTVFGGPAGLSNIVAIASGSSHSLAVVGTGAPAFTSGQIQATINPGRTARFYAPASGAWPISYQWQFGGTDIPGATGPILSVSNVQTANLGTYHVTATNPVQTAVSPSASLSLLPIVGPDACPNLSNVVAVAGTINGQQLALKPDSTVVAWGQNSYGDAIVPSGLSNVIAISTGKSLSGGGDTDHSLALTTNGLVHSWGANTFTNTSPMLTNTVAISGGAAGDVALTADGRLTGWSGTLIYTPSLTNVVAVAAGKGTSFSWVAALADGTVTSGGLPIAPSGLSNVVAVAAGYNQGLALLSDGSVTAWGGSAAGEGNVPAGLSNVIALAGGNYYSLALKADGTVVAWGNVPASISNVVATVTNGVSIDSGIALIGSGPPVLATPLVNRYGMPSGNVLFHALATGQWPLSYQWQLNGAPIPGGTNPSLEITNLTLQNGGSYAVVLTNSAGSITSNPAILTIYDLSPALDTSNVVWTTFGSMLWFAETNVTHDGISAAQSGPMSIGTSTLRGTMIGPGTLTFWYKVTGQPSQGALLFYINGYYWNAVLAGTDWHQTTIYLGPGTQVVDWNFEPTTSIASPVSAFVDDVVFTPGSTTPTITLQPASQSQAPSANATFNIAVRGTPPFAYQWRFNETDIPGATTSPMTISNLQATNAGNYSVLVSNIAGSALSSNGTLVLGRIAQWGNPNFPLPPAITNATMLAAGIYHGLALQTDHSLLAWGYNNANQIVLPTGLTNLDAIGAGWSFSLAVNATDGTVVAWGDNSYGQTNVPAGLSNVLMVAGGSFHVAALKVDGTVVAWGRNSYGEMNVPVDLTNAVAIAAGNEHNIALRADGTVTAWGDNSYGETNVPAGLSDVVAVRAGFDFCLALKSDGTVVYWGTTNNGIGSVPAGLSNRVGIAAGGEFSLVLKPDGTVLSWGFDRSGDTIIPAALTNVESITAGSYFSLALVGDGPPSPNIPVRNPALSQNLFSVTVPTQCGRVYRLEYKNSLTDSSWLSLPLVPGNGRERILTDPSPVVLQRFYRVRSW